MFDFVEKYRTVVKVLLVLVALGLTIGFGLSGYGAFSEPYLAKVGNAKITERDFAQAVGGQNVPDNQRGEVLNQLIQRQLLLNEAGDLYLGASKEVLQYVISNIPSFMENGQFSQERYRSVLASQQKTPEQYEAELAREIRIQQLLRPVIESQFLSKTAQQRLSELLLEKREVSVARFIPQMTIAQTQVSAEEIKQYYEANSKAFELPAQVRVEYIVLAQEALTQGIQVSEEEIQQYMHNQGGAQEERQARHILLAIPDNADARVKAEVKARAEAVLKQVKANPAKFAEIARSVSQDPGSAAQGGELGFFKQGVMVPAFDKAVFSMKKGEISDLVETQFGYHIIQVVDIRTPSEEALKNEAIAALKKQKAAQLFSKERVALAEALPMAKDLKSVGSKFHLAVQTSDWLSKNTAKDALFNQEALRQAIFADDVLNKQYNTDLIEVQPGLLVAARVIEKKPATQQTLDEVSALIAAKLREEKALKLAKEMGKKALADLKAGQNVKLAWSDSQMIDRLTPSDQATAVREIFKIPANALPGYVGAETPYGYAIYKVKNIIPVSPEDQENLKNIGTELQQFYGRANASAYLRGLQKKYKIEVPRTAVPEQ